MILSELKEKLNSLPEWANKEEVNISHVFDPDDFYIEIYEDDTFEIKYIDCLPTNGINMVIE